ncbi:hypothetical protein LCGC14_3130290, partial [marine sediment metagenome]
MIPSTITATTSVRIAATVVCGDCIFFTVLSSVHSSKNTREPSWGLPPFPRPRSLSNSSCRISSIPPGPAPGPGCGIAAASCSGKFAGSPASKNPALTGALTCKEVGDCLPKASGLGGCENGVSVHNVIELFAIPRCRLYKLSQDSCDSWRIPRC